MERRERDGVTVKAEFVKLVKFVGQLADFIHLVDDGDHGLPRLFQHDGDVAVVRDQPALHVAQEDDDVGSLDGEGRLTAHLPQNGVVALRLDTAGIDEKEAMLSPLRIRIDTVAGNARRILDDGTALADNLIEQCAFADIRSADDSNDRF